MPAHKMNRHAQLFVRGARQLGAHPFAPPIAIDSEPSDGRPAYMYCGWCGSGFPTNAKATAGETRLKRAERLGAQVMTEAFVRRVNYDAAHGRASGVEWIDAEGREHETKARIVALAAHAAETPRLLLLWANAAIPPGLTNSSGQVGRGLMSRSTWQVFGAFDAGLIRALWRRSRTGASTLRGE